MISNPGRVERGVYTRVNNGKREYGSRCDDLTGETKWMWGFPSAVRARHDYQAKRAKVRKARDMAGETTPTNATIRELTDEYIPTIQSKRVEWKSQQRHLNWWADYFKKQPVLTIRPIDVEKAFTKLRDEGHSMATANRYGETLRHLMRKLVSPADWSWNFGDGSISMTRRCTARPSTFP